MIICRTNPFKFQTSAQNERKSLQAQITNERILAADQSRTYEKEIDRLSKEIEDFGVEKREMYIETVSTNMLLPSNYPLLMRTLLIYSQEKLDRERKQLEKVEALFEQRKIAAHDDLANADHTMSIIREAEARLNDEMERLSQLLRY